MFLVVNNDTVYYTTPSFLITSYTFLECHAHDIKQSNGETPVLELWEIRSILSLQLISSTLRPGAVAPKTVLSVGQIKPFDIKTV